MDPKYISAFTAYGTAVDQLLADFKNCPDISYLYVTHTITSGFVTHYKGDRNFDEDQNKKSDICLPG